MRPARRSTTPSSSPNATGGFVLRRAIRPVRSTAEKKTLFKLLEAEERIGMGLTEHFAMYPAASVSGWYFAHPQSRYFGVGKIGEDQAEDYAARKGIDPGTARSWLRPNLG